MFSESQPLELWTGVMMLFVYLSLEADGSSLVHPMAFVSIAIFQYNK